MKKFIFILACAFIAFAGCSLFSSPAEKSDDNERNSLFVLSFNDSSRKMTPASYELNKDSVSVQFFKAGIDGPQNIRKNTGHEFSWFVPEGIWNIEVSAQDTKGNDLFGKLENLHISGGYLEKKVRLSYPKTGTGSINITIDCSNNRNLTSSLSYKAKLISLDSDTSYEVELTKDYPKITLKKMALILETISFIFTLRLMTLKKMKFSCRKALSRFCKAKIQPLNFTLKT